MSRLSALSEVRRMMSFGESQADLRPWLIVFTDVLAPGRSQVGTYDNRKAVTGLNPVTAFPEDSERRR